MDPNKRSRIGWVLYDFANSTYHLMMPTILMPLFFREYLACDSPSADFQWAILVSLSVVLAGVSGPFVGAFADSHRCRLAVLVASASGAILFAALVPAGQVGNVLLGGCAFTASYLCFTLSLGIYDAFLPLVVARESRGRLSGLAWGIGYLGGIVALVAVYPILGEAQLPEGANSFRAAIWITCLIFAVFSVPSFLLLRKSSFSGASTASCSAKATGLGVGRVWNTLMEWRSNRELFKTIISYYLANDGLATLVYFTSIYAASTLGFDSKQILVLFLIVQVVGVPASIAGGIAADRLGHKRVLYTALAIWVVLCAGFSVCEGIVAFYTLSIGTGLVIGTTPAVYRSLLAEFIPTEKTAEYYGFNSFASRASSVLGPLLFGAITAFTGSQRYAMVALLVFFVLAAAILRTVRGGSIPTVLKESAEVNHA